jgi:hypothetical protein
MVIAIFLYFIAPVFFILALVKPDWFGLEDAKQTLKRFAIFLGVGFVAICLILYFIGTRLSLPDLSSTAGLIMLITMFLVITTILLSWILPFLSNRSQRTQNLLMIGVGLVTFTGMMTSGLAQNTIPTKILDAAYTVCQGQSIPEAAVYGAADGKQKVVVLYDKGDSYTWESLMPGDTWPESLEDLTMVACLGEETSKDIQTCAYVGGPSITRYQYQRPIRLINAKTGEVIASGIVKAKKPGACPQSADRDKTTIRGPRVDKGNINQWLKEYINP